VVGGRVAHGGIVGGGICDPLALANGIAVWVLITALRDRPPRPSDVAQLGRGEVGAAQLASLQGAYWPNGRADVLRSSPPTRFRAAG
jgi:hypothetical protein